MAELEAEEKNTTAKKAYESYGVVLDENIFEQGLAKKQHEAYFFDANEKEDERLDKECYAMKCFRLRANYPAIELIEQFFVYLWKRDWTVT